MKPRGRSVQLAFEFSTGSGKLGTHRFDNRESVSSSSRLFLLKSAWNRTRWYRSRTSGETGSSACVSVASSGSSTILGRGSELAPRDTEGAGGRSKTSFSNSSDDKGRSFEGPRYGG